MNFCPEVKSLNIRKAVKPPAGFKHHYLRPTISSKMKQSFTCQTMRGLSDPIYVYKQTLRTQGPSANAKNSDKQMKNQLELHSSFSSKDFNDKKKRKSCQKKDKTDLRRGKSILIDYEKNQNKYKGNTNQPKKIKTEVKTKNEAGGDKMSEKNETKEKQKQRIEEKNEEKINMEEVYNFLKTLNDDKDQTFKKEQMPPNLDKFQFELRYQAVKSNLESATIYETDGEDETNKQSVIDSLERESPISMVGSSDPNTGKCSKKSSNSSKKCTPTLVTKRKDSEEELPKFDPELEKKILMNKSPWGDEIEEVCPKFVRWLRSEVPKKKEESCPSVQTSPSIPLPPMKFVKTPFKPLRDM